MALGKRTAQSSIRNDAFSSYRAVDGNTNNNFRENSCMRTKAERNPWWMVDLGRVDPVTEVYIVNRGDCCGERLNPFEIRVGKC